MTSVTMGASAWWMQAKRDLLHLRLNMSYVLSPIFLWGFLLSFSPVGVDAILGFLLFHVFLYGGANAYNSFYDKDEGPVGGLRHPPPVARSTLHAAVAMKAVGLLLSIFVNVAFVALYLGFAVLSVAYSHPAVRLKSSPVGSSLFVFFGQGALGFLAGFACGEPELSGIARPSSVLGLASACLITLGIYPLTQVYQLSEDRARGDRTLAMALGVHGSFAFALAALAAAGVLVLYVLASVFTVVDVIALGAAFALILVLLARWFRAFHDGDVLSNHAAMMRLHYTNATLFVAYLLVRIAGAHGTL